MRFYTLFWPPTQTANFLISMSWRKRNLSQKSKFSSFGKLFSFFEISSRHIRRVKFELQISSSRCCLIIFISWLFFKLWWAILWFSSRTSYLKLTSESKTIVEQNIPQGIKKGRFESSFWPLAPTQNCSAKLYWLSVWKRITHIYVHLYFITLQKNRVPS